MANKSLFTVQYSHALDKFFLTEKENPESGVPFDIEIIDCDNNSLIELGSIMIDKEELECSKPAQLSFSNPFNLLFLWDSFGLLYNHFVVEEENFAPEGWHIPTRDECYALINFLGGDGLEGNKLKSTSFDFWDNDLVHENDPYNFSAPGAGYISNTRAFTFFKSYAHFWTSYIPSGNFAYNINIASAFGNLNLNTTNKLFGCSVRFIKDDNVLVENVEDYEGNKYPVCQIGEQIWTAVNWKSKYFFDGSAIPFCESDTDWPLDGSLAAIAPPCDENLL